MRICTFSLLTFLAPLALAGEPAPAAPPTTSAEAAGLKTEEQKTLYALGVWLANQVQVFGLTAGDLGLVTAGLRDGILGQKLKVDLNVYGGRLNDLARSRAEAKAAAQKKKDQAFLDKAAKEKGAQRAASGLVFLELKPGTGGFPASTDTVRVHYHGTLPDGKVFDSSVDRGAPAEFPLSGVIPCWTEGVQKIKVGGKARLVCPPNIAYGDQGSPPKIPGGAALVFEVELLDIVKKQPSRAGGD